MNCIVTVRSAGSVQAECEITSGDPPTPPTVAVAVCELHEDGRDCPGVGEGVAEMLLTSFNFALNSPNPVIVIVSAQVTNALRAL
jgi:hypothetical protein